MSQLNLIVQQIPNYLIEQSTLEENQQSEEALDQEFALVEERQNYYQLAYYECDRI